MLTEIRITADGSPTLFVPELNEHYHSIHGAFQESMHVFINSGFNHLIQQNNTIQILEIGTGTGLNVWMTAAAAAEKKISTTYFGLEPFPPAMEILNALYSTSLRDMPLEWINRIRKATPNKAIEINEFFTCSIIPSRLEDFKPENKFNLIYFDAFGPDVHPEIWSQENFNKLFTYLYPNGCLVTYCAKGIVRRRMMEAGFTIERLPGPPGKREMLRATKSELI